MFRIYTNENQVRLDFVSIEYLSLDCLIFFFLEEEEREMRKGIVDLEKLFGEAATIRLIVLHTIGCKREK